MNLKSMEENKANPNNKSIPNKLNDQIQWMIANPTYKATSPEAFLPEELLFSNKQLR